MKARSWNFLFAGCLLAVFLATTGCRSYHVEITVENHTGAAIQLLEVDYPSASFGADSLAAGAEFHYRIQVQGSGALKVQYTGAGGRKVSNVGPALAERQQGRLTVELLPEGKVAFQNSL